MRAARWHGRGDVRIEDVPVPVPAPDELLVEVLWCGICGTDLEEYRDGPLTIPVQPHPRRGTRAPITLGHEVAGRVHTAAADGSGPPAGAVVVPDVVIGCGACWWCRRHEEGLCPELAVRGQTEDGGLARFMPAHAATCLVVPPGVAPESAALVEPASVAVRALRKAGDLLGARVAVVGAGTVGQLVARCAVAAGAVVELVVDPVPSRRELAVAHGARAAADPAGAAGAGGYDAVVECSGADGALPLALDLARRGGTVVAVGLRARPEMLDVVGLVLGEKRLVGSAAHLWDTDCAPALDLIASGRLPVDDLISRRVPLERVVEDGFGALADRAGDVLKVLVDCR
ncbi:alcohol dehydrogenase catalytic domain-containing protein [Jiangella alkaliphila]|uniref:(R,R)-butanediol dehydrogenase / meso-butanediol dehydrogenase / diacetyl reductase n=1 Tax=Jiangella alkaliphila TaxID=419479 RepID=A0A1H2LVR3_9ACTN|nr:alcohol dehydrogenase catalytic domain-containing protein [Jiangella alkaliphila]SDU85019.1 (R,R)-butanediol dehydrogenase / meso-butanediol dehydrogenase / diacetyl reductase [Jiangella alkaliphila]